MRSFANSGKLTSYVDPQKAWISASLLFAYQLQKMGPGASVAPGPIVFDAVGWTGLIFIR